MEKIKKMNEKTEKGKCEDRFCPFHGKTPLKLRGKIFQGTVIKKLPSRITIQFNRMLKIKKYERYEKRKTKLHSRLPDCLKDKINIGDLVEISETRPISKTIHTVVTKLIKSKNNESSNK